MTAQELELPEGWIEIKLDDIAIRLQAGGTPSKGKSEYYQNGTIPFVKIDDITSSTTKYLETTKVKITKQGLSDSSAWLVIENSLLYSMYASYGIPIINKIKVATSQAIIVYQPPKDLISLDFVYYFLKFIGPFSTPKGTTQENLNAGIIKNYKVLLPPLNEQKRIVLKIEELFSKIDSAKQLLEHTKLQLEQYRHSLLKSAFEGKLTKEWRKKNKSTPNIEWADYDKKKNSIMKIYNETLQDLITIPDDWYWLDIESLTESMKNGIYKQKKFYTDDGIACLRMYNIENWSLVWKKIKRLDLTPKEISEYELKFDDILVNRVNSLELVGKSALIPKTIEKCVFESKNIRLRLKIQYIKPQLALFWLVVASKHYFYKNFQQTAGMASINQTQLGELPIPYCSSEEQEQIVSQIEHGFSLIKNTQQIVNSTLQQLETMEISILKQAFEGKLVPQDPNDEPASVLLERIQKEKLRIRQ